MSVVQRYLKRKEICKEEETTERRMILYNTVQLHKYTTRINKRIKDEETQSYIVGRKETSGYRATATALVARRRLRPPQGSRIFPNTVY